MNIKQEENFTMNTKHKGFTLIELVILLAIIGIVAAVMAFMNIHSASSSRASRIIHDFRNLKTAAVSWHRDNKSSDLHDRKSILSYLNNKSMVKVAEAAEEKGSYILRTTDGGKSWFVGCELNDAKTKGKLTAKAGTLKLLGSDMKSVYNNDPQVWVQVLPERTGS